MKILQYNRDFIPDSNYCVFIPHEPHPPYIDGWDYCLYTFPNIIRYCQHYDIDLVMLTNFQQDKHGSSIDIYGRINKYPFIVVTQLLQKYQYIFHYMSDFLIKKCMPHFKDFIGNFDCIVPASDCGVSNLIDNIDIEMFQYIKHGIIGSIEACKELITHEEYIKCLAYYQNNNKYWWSGPGIITNHNMKHWFDPVNIQKFKFNDMGYRYVNHAIDSNSYKFHIEQNINIQEMQYIIRQILLLSPNSEYQILNVLKKIDLRRYFDLQQFKLIHFGACGSYTSLYKLRTMLIKHILDKYRGLLW